MKMEYTKPAYRMVMMEATCLSAVSSNRDFTYGGEDNGENTPASRSIDGMDDGDW